MKTLYLDCGMGAAGDMLTAALLELLPDPDGFVQELNALSIPGVEFIRESSVKCGITGTHMSVLVHGSEEGEEHFHSHSHEHDHEHTHEHHHEHIHEHGHGHDHEHEHHHEHSQEHHHEHAHEESHEHGHHHSGLHEIEHILSDLSVPDRVKENALAVYRLIAEAESHVHGVPIQEIHFHEVGTADAVADVVAVCLLMDRLSPDEVVSSPVHVGSGQVRCAHGILPVPAPATAFLLRDIPIYGGAVKGELCTPTGAALLKHFVTRFGDLPVMKTKAIGYGMGKKDFERANCVRALLGEREARTGTVLELCCNLDDMTAEAIGFASERLFEGGALEVYTVPIGMKKSRPGTMLCVLCDQKDKDRLVHLLFMHTTTIGIRETEKKRYFLDREIETVTTSYGEVRRKRSSGYGVSRMKYEYEDLSRIAREKNISLEEVKKQIEADV